MKIEPVLTPVIRFGNLLRDEKKQIYAIYFYSVLNGGVGLILPLGIQAIINFILGGRMTTSWLILVLIVSFGYIFGGFLEISQRYLMEKLQQRIFTNTSFSFAYRLPRIKMDVLRDKFPPELANRIFDAVNLQKGTAKLIIDYSTYSVQILFGLILLTFYHPFFIFFGLLLLIILFGIFYFTSGKGIKTAMKESTSKYETAYWLEEIARTCATFKLAGNSNLPFIRVDKILQKYVDFRNNHFNILIFQHKVMIGFKVLIMGGFLIVGSSLLIDDEISIGQFVAAEIVIMMIISSVEKLILDLEVAYDTLVAVEKIGLIMDMEMEKAEGTEKAFKSEYKGLEFEISNLTYQTIDKEETILDKINLKINPGEKIILTGGSGSGKSTLIHLMAGLFEDYTGKIQVNGLPISTMNLEKYRSIIGDSLLHESLFLGTIRENITLGKDIPEENIRKIIELVGLNKYIFHLPDDIDTQVLPEGRGLSKVLISKIILARCLVGEPKALLLEEMFYHISNEVRERVMDYMMKEPFTMILITQDWDLITKVDRVIELEKGSITFDGDSLQYKEIKGI
ncbi:peptidase domain-containing ABC transporter [Pararhodonellum marinum]|uniref:peptidase domain-containing ABC transporter n=1 Tax=Pararhodonellum marinum TaxID=2755358 RepID=UPI00188EFDDB|nr:ATP-binding cassette domain-containing protein [Pararhodonellum marinum]